MRKSDIEILIVIFICVSLAFGAGIWLGYKIAYDKYQPYYEHPTEASKPM